MQFFEQMLYGLSATGNSQLRSNLMERNQYKSPLIQPGMRKLEPSLSGLDIVYEQDIQIQRPRAIGNRFRTVPAEFLFDRQQLIEQRARLERRIQCHHRIHKPGLRGISNRLSGIKRRSADQGAELAQPPRRRSQCGIRRPRHAGQVRSKRDVSGAHGLRLTRGAAVNSPLRGLALAPLPRHLPNPNQRCRQRGQPHAPQCQCRIHDPGRSFANVPQHERQKIPARDVHVIPRVLRH